jgi:hypothetical protein
MGKDSGGFIPVDISRRSDVDERRSRARRALVAFWVLTLGSAAAGAAVGSTMHHALLGLAVGALVGAVLGTVVTVVMAMWPVLRAVWHWLPELLTVAGLVAGLTWLAGVTGSWWWTLPLLVPVGAGAAWGPTRRPVVAWVWVLIVRHRLRLCFASFIRARNRLDPALAPLVLAARPTPAGERVWVWLRTGLDVAELENRTAKIAVTCWASDVQVTVSRRFAALVRVDVTRRDPLTGLVISPLVGLVPPAAAAVVDPVEVGGLDLDEVPEDLVIPAPRGGAR